MSIDIPGAQDLFTVEQMIKNINQSYVKMHLSMIQVSTLRKSSFTESPFVNNAITRELGNIEDQRQAILTFAQMLQFAPFAEEMVQSEAKRDIA
nr:hypothetical protein 26 [Balneolaceae bacterium]